MLSEKQYQKLLTLYIIEKKSATIEELKNFTFDFDSVFYLHSELTLKNALYILNMDIELNTIDLLFNAIELKGRGLRTTTHPLRVNRFLNRLQKYPAEKIYKKLFENG